MKRLYCFVAASMIVMTGMSLMVCAAQEKTDEQILSDIKEHPYRVAAAHSPYYAPDVNYTPAPKGYEAFYISHLGRHGSRFQTNGSDVYDGVVALLDSLHFADALTLEGDSLRMEFHHMQQAHLSMNGMLTRKGTAEHIGIAERLVGRCPSVFKQKDRHVVYCTSTQVQRTIQSMAGFMAGLRGAGDDLDFSIGCGFNLLDYRLPEEDVDYSALRDSVISVVSQAMAPESSELDAIQARLFKGFKASDKVLFDLFKASSTAGCLDIDVDPLRFFTAEELFAFFKKYDAATSAKLGTLVSIRSKTAIGGEAYVRLIVNDADKALDGNGHCADLRFAHDSNVGSLMNLLGIGGYAFTAFENAPYRYWQSYSQICMSSNLQLEFYRNSDSDVLVKALFNEIEIGFPGLEAVDNVFYKWSDVRRYMLAKCGDISEVPDYYSSYLDSKVAQIKDLQDDEVVGFYFITDMHFPRNNGRSAALIEHLENVTGKRLIVYGGDALTYLDDIEEAMSMQISALEQMRGASPILWTRGNHDIVNYTGKKEWIKGERKAYPAWESVKLLKFFRPMSVVTNEVADPYTSYCYYDEPDKKVRYIVFDTTDKVQDDNRQNGISETQLKWIIEKAILGAPDGYGLVFISHIPFLGENLMLPAGYALSAFSKYSKFEFAGKKYDFSKRKDLRFLCAICGHNHQDYSINFPGGQPQINVLADCNYDIDIMVKGTVDEQGFDYVSISKDGHIHTVRIGIGKNRDF